MTRAGIVFVPTDKEVADQKKRDRRFKLLCGAVLAFVAIGFGLAFFFDIPKEQDDKAQESAATAYLDEVAKQTRGGIRPDTSDYGAVGARIDGDINVTLVVGDCPGVEGYIESPARPESKADLGELRIEVPGSNRYAAHAFPVINWNKPNWSEPLTRGDSALNHCIPRK